MIQIDVTCPRCFVNTISIVWDPGSPGVHTMPNGDPGYPADPPGLEEIHAECECWPDDDPDANAPEMIAALVGAWLAFQHAAEARTLDALAEDIRDA